MKWFKHDADANMDARLQEVLLDYGLEGYGLYWYCIELITSKITSDNLTFELEHDARIIARNTGSSVQKVEEMMRRLVDIGLFENLDGRITCMKLAKRLDKSMTNSPQMRVFIDKLRASGNVMTLSDNVSPEGEGEGEENKDICIQQAEHEPVEIQLDIEDQIDQGGKQEYPHKLTLDQLKQISLHWENSMSGISPLVDLTKKTQVNKKRWAKINKVLKDHPEYWDHEYFSGYFDRLATMQEFEWQRANNQLSFDQALQLDKFERNRDVMLLAENKR